MAGGVHGRGHAWWGGGCMTGGMCGWGACVTWGGMCGGGHVWLRGEACVAGEIATAAGGTHPTGMHSCLITASKLTVSGIVKSRKLTRCSIKGNCEWYVHLT